MTFSPEWETLHSSPEPKYRTISGNLSFLLGLFGSLRGKRILEFGCGIGNNAWPIMQDGADYYGIDGSPSAIQRALSFENTKGAHFAWADFTRENPFGSGFDAVFDRASIVHNDLEGIRSAIEIAFEALNPGGLFFGCDWFSMKHSEAHRGRQIEPGTRTDYPNGQFENVGKVHFTTEQELSELFSAFDPIMLFERVHRYPAVGGFLTKPAKYRWVSREFWGKEYISAVFDFVAMRPE